MTTPPSPVVASLSDASGVLLADGWHVTPQGIAGVLTPSFTDPFTGAQITPGDNWVQFADDGGLVYACPFRAILGLKLAAPAIPPAGP